MNNTYSNKTSAKIEVFVLDLITVNRLESFVAVTVVAAVVVAVVAAVVIVVCACTSIAWLSVK